MPAVIDASGACRRGQFLDMGGDVEVIAGFQYEILDVPNDGYLDFYLWPKYSPHGYVWMIPKEGGRANVGLVTTDKKGAHQVPESFIQDTYLNGKPTVNPPWRAEGIKIRPFGGTIPISTTNNDGWRRRRLVAMLQALPRRCSKAARTWPLVGTRSRTNRGSALGENNLSGHRLMAYERA